MRERTGRKDERRTLTLRGVDFEANLELLARTGEGQGERESRTFGSPRQALERRARVRLSSLGIPALRVRSGRRGPGEPEGHPVCCRTS